MDKCVGKDHYLGKHAEEDLDQNSWGTVKVHFSNNLATWIQTYLNKFLKREKWF